MKTNSIHSLLRHVAMTLLIVLSLVCLLRPVNAYAATEMKLVTMGENKAPGFKVGTKYYRVVSIQVSDEDWETAYQVSSSAKKGYKSLIQVPQGNIGSEFVTDGKNIYYFSNNKLNCFNIAKKKKSTVMTVKKAVKNSGLQISHVKGNDLYVLNMAGRVDVKRIYKINVKKKTCKILARNVTVLDTFSYSRYNTLKKDGKDGLCSLFVFDKETGKLTLISNCVAGPPATAGGGDYPRPNDDSSKYTTYIEYNNLTGTYTLMTYKFAAQKAKAQKAWKWNPAKLSSLMVYHDYTSLKKVNVRIEYPNGKTDYILVDCRL